MKRNKKLIIFLIVVLICALIASYLFLRDNAKTLKPGDKDPKTGCTVVQVDKNGIVSALCN
jgi:hypothetical protein